MIEVHLSINNDCELVASPDTFAEDLLSQILYPCEDVELENGVYLEFLINRDINPDDTISVTTVRDFYIQPLKQDGLYIYYLVKIKNSETIDEDYKGLYYDFNKNELIFNKQKLTNIEEFATQILPTLDYDNGVEEYVQKCIFSTCKLKRCLLDLQKQFNYNCRKGFCQKSDSTKDLRDFLFITIYILDTFISQEKYSEAVDLLDSISGCGSICASVSHKKTECNCK